MLYLIIILICSLIIYIPNALVNPANINMPWVYYLLALLIFIAAEVLLDAIIAIIGRRMIPKSWVNPKKGFIRTRDWEMRLFKKMGVDQWKKYLPDLGRFTDFPKGSLTDPYNNQYIARYIEEASYGVWIHYMSVPFSLPAILLMLIDVNNPTIWTVGVPVIIVNMLLILAPALSLKFNIPRLMRIYENNERLIAKKKALEEANK